jgi:transposase
LPNDIGRGLSNGNTWCQRQRREVYRFKQRLCYLLLKEHGTRKQCEQLAHRFLRALQDLKSAGLAQLVQLGQTLSSWATEVAMMWRFTRNNGITEGFHTKMEVLQRQAYGFRKFPQLPIEG